MNILLDTHIALWALSDHPKLSKYAREIIDDPKNTVYYSSVSVWEVLLKHNSTKNALDLSTDNFVQFCDEAGFIPLNMCPGHVITASELDTSAAEKITVTRSTVCSFLRPNMKTLLSLHMTANFVYTTNNAFFSSDAGILRDIFK